MGRNIGPRCHEPRFVGVGDETIKHPCMRFTVEPELYVAGLGSLRHSDKILVTSSEPESLTDYPRDLEQLTLPLGSRPRC